MRGWAPSAGLVGGGVPAALFALALAAVLCALADRGDLGDPDGNRVELSNDLGR